MSAAPHGVAVVGGGPVGAALGVALAREGVDVAMLEAADPERLEAPPAASGLGFDLRTVALAPAMVDWLMELGIWDATCERSACAYARMEVWDANGTGRIAFDAAEVGVERLGTIIEHRVLLAACWHALRAQEGVTVRAPARAAARVREAAGHSTLVLAEGPPLSAHLVVGADGAGSQVRDWAGIDVVAYASDQVALATVVRTRHPHASCARQCFLADGPLALLPLADAHHLSVVWSMTPARAAALEALDATAFAAALTHASEAVLGAVEAVDRRVVFPLPEQHARHYVAPGVALVGDAAHVIHPLAGQGVNLGLRDARALAAELCRARRLTRNPGIFAALELLRRYERARRGENTAMLQAMRGLRALFGAQPLELRWVRNVGLRWVNGAAPVKRRLMWQAMAV